MVTSQKEEKVRQKERKKRILRPFILYWNSFRFFSHNWVNPTAQSISLFQKPWKAHCVIHSWLAHYLPQPWVKRTAVALIRLWDNWAFTISSIPQCGCIQCAPNKPILPSSCFFFFFNFFSWVTQDSKVKLFIKDLIDTEILSIKKKKHPKD